MHRILLVAHATACVLTASPIVAQPPTRISAFGGVATDQRGQRGTAVGLAPTVTFTPHDQLSAQLSGAATRFGSRAWALSGGAALAAREPLAPRLAFSLRASMTASRLHSATPGTFMQGEMSPTLELAIGRATVFGGGRLLGGRATESTPATPLLPALRTSAVARSGGGRTYGVTVALPGSSSASTLTAREDRATVAGVPFTDRVVGLVLTRGALSLTTSAGRRAAPDERAGFASAAIAIPLTPNTTLDVAGGQYPSDRTLATPAGRFMSVGLSVAAGRRSSDLPTPAGIAPASRGVTRLALRAKDARAVAVAGDFSRWKLVPARRAANGVWYVDLVIPPGRYRYAFRVNGSEWRVPHGATAVDDGFGGKSAWLDVP